MKIKKISIYFLLIVLFVSCSSVPKTEKITVNGMVYDTENRPAVNYNITLNGKVVAITDIGGRFTLNNIKTGTYNFSGFGEGYLSITDTVDIFDKSQILYLKVPTIESKFKEAYDYINQSKYSKAKNSIKEVLESDENNSIALYFMSVIENFTGNTNESRKYLEKIINNGDENEYVKKMEDILNNK